MHLHGLTQLRSLGSRTSASGSLGSSFPVPSFSLPSPPSPHPERASNAQHLAVFDCQTHLQSPSSTVLVRRLGLSDQAMSEITAEITRGWPRRGGATSLQARSSKNNDLKTFFFSCLKRRQKEILRGNVNYFFSCSGCCVLRSLSFVTMPVGRPYLCLCASLLASDEPTISPPWIVQMFSKSRTRHSQTVGKSGNQRRGLHETIVMVEEASARAKKKNSSVISSGSC